MPSSLPPAADTAPLSPIDFFDVSQPAIMVYWAVVFFIFGLFFGSFFNVAIYRIPAGLSVNHPKRSFCYRCGSMVLWYDNLPVISYLMLRGKCRHCGTGFSARYMMVELLTALLFVAIFLGVHLPDPGRFQFASLWYCAFASLLIIGSFTDLDTWIIPDGITIGGAIAALVAAIPIGLLDPMPLLAVYGPFPVLRVDWGSDIFMLISDLLRGPALSGISASDIQWWEPLANALLGAMFGPALLYGVAILGKIIFRKDAMGMGDVKLFALIGATLGITGSILTLFFACFIGSIIGGLGILLGKVGQGKAPILQEGPRLLRERRAGADSEEAPDPEKRDLLIRLGEIALGMPRPRQVHHLPFGPSIALAGLIVVIFHHAIHRQFFAWM